MDAGERHILFYHTRFPTPALPGSGCMGMISAYLRHPYDIQESLKKRNELPLHLPTPVLSGSGYKGTISAHFKAPLKLGAKILKCT